MNGMTTRAVCSPSPQPSPSRERGVVRAGIILWGSLSPVGEGKKANLREVIVSFPVQRNGRAVSHKLQPFALRHDLPDAGKFRAEMR